VQGITGSESGFLNQLLSLVQYDRPSFDQLPVVPVFVESRPDGEKIPLGYRTGCPLRLNADRASTRARAEEGRRYRWSYFLAADGPASFRYRFTNTLVSKYAQRAAAIGRPFPHEPFERPARRAPIEVPTLEGHRAWMRDARTLQFQVSE